MLAMIIITFAHASATSDQVAKDIDFILRHHTENQVPADKDARFEAKRISEPEIFAKGLIKLYQMVISSQDITACNFTPSCSRFTMEAIQKGGLVKGVLLGGDRLMRCHWLAHKLYREEYGVEFYHKSERLYDPVKRYLGSKSNQ
jgi:putative component of membrane protein insertase Oxa1/YidC/SpoIIIJ protein YidD